MAHNLVEADTFTAAIAVPDDGDACNAASVEAGAQDMADRTRYLYNRSAGAKGGTLAIDLGASCGNTHADSSAGVHFVLPAVAPMTPVPGCWSQNDIGDTGRLAWDITAQLHFAGMVGARITSVTATVDGDAAGAAPPHAAKPATMPVVRLAKLNLATGALATEWSGTDNAADQPTYDSVHSFSASGVTTIAAGFRYLIEFLGEAGANAEAGLTILGITVTVAP